MKKLKLLLIPIILFSLTGCIKQDNFEDITIYTTIYPVEYIVDNIYGEYSEIKSIYPYDVNTDSYELTKKQIKDYSNMDLYVFNGTSTKEAGYVTSIFKHNKDLKIIDATNSMEYNYSMKELWLDPSNFLMMALNIKNGILEYTSNHYLNETIEKNYQDLKINISKIDAKLKLLYENANVKVIVVDDSAFKFLEKYGFKVISLEETDELNEKTILEVKNLINNENVKTIFSTNPDKLNETVKAIKDETDVNISKLYLIDNLTDEQRKKKEDYISLLNENIEILKNELYN